MLDGLRCQVSMSPDKDIEAVDFGDGAFWEVAHVEIQEPPQDEYHDMPEMVSEEDADEDVDAGRGWQVKTSRAAQRRQRKSRAFCHGFRRGCCEGEAPGDCCQNPPIEELQKSVKQRSAEIEAGLKRYPAGSRTRTTGRA